MHLQCTHCERTFTKTEHLRRHERSHTNEKPFTCKHCNRSYARSDVLARHLRMHARKEEDSVNGHTAISTAGSRISGSTNTAGRRSSTPYERIEHKNEQYNGETPYPNQPMHLHNQFSPATLEYGTFQPRPASFQPSLQTLYAVPQAEYPVNLVQENPQFDRQTQTYIPVFEPPRPPGSPVRYANFPPGQPEDFEPEQSAHVFHDANTSRWTGNAESYIRGTVGMLKEQSRTTTPQHSSNLYENLNVKTEAVGLDGLQKWLQASQQANPVNAILKFDSIRGPLDGVLSLRNEYQPSPIAAAGASRLAKVEQTWYSRLSSQCRAPGVEKKWYDILHTMPGDLFDGATPSCEIPEPGQPVRVSEACRLRMMQAVYPPITNPYHPASLANLTSSTALDRFPTCEQFDKALDKYFAVFSREAPFFHRPTFSISTCNPLLLITMSCIGFALNKTNENVHFVQNNFNCVRDRILTELDRKLASTTKDAAYIFATSFIFLKLAALITDRDHLSPCQLLYASLINLAQLHGIFAELGRSINANVYDNFPDLEEKWRAWSRVESMKRIAISLMRLDSAYATFLRTTPNIRVQNIRILLPCADILFEAPTAARWWQIVQTGEAPLVMPIINANTSLDKLVGQTSLDYYSLHAVLNYLQLRNLDAYQRLTDYQATQEDQFILMPYQYYATEPSLQSVTMHVVAFINSYQALLPSFAGDWQRTNCLVFWHFLCLSLTMNQDLFEIAAGREGPSAAASAIASIATWSKTPAARRALVHSAQVHHLLVNRKEYEMSSLYAAFATFAGALVMTLYVFANPPAEESTQPFELTSSIEWVNFGFAGLEETTKFKNGGAAERFILEGGSYTFNSHRIQGFTGARYILTLYADLLRDCGRYNYRQMSRILLMMSELLEHVS